MFCIKCRAQNPDDAQFCYQCGKGLFKPETNTSETPVVASVEPATPELLLPLTEPAPRTATTAAGYKWVTAYGWLFLVAGIYFLYTGLVTEVGVAIFQGLLFGLTGTAILQRTKFAVALVWITVVVSGLGVIFRSITPLDLLLWLMWLGLAIWYTKKRQLRTSNDSARFVIGEGERTAVGLGSPVSTVSASNQRSIFIISAIGLLAVLLLFAIGFAGFLNNSGYTYLTQGNVQYRVDSSSGRTDRLDDRNGWEPLSFDRPPDNIPPDVIQNHIGLRLGFLDYVANEMAGRTCFLVQNNSDYALQEVTVRMSATNPIDEALWNGNVTVKNEDGGLLATGKVSRFCAPRLSSLPKESWKTLRYSATSAKGWKQ